MSSPAQRNPLRIGFLINPIAGLGGKVGLHGTDGRLAEIARERGAKNHSASRARITLQGLKQLEGIEFLTPAGEMGGALLGQLHQEEVLSVPFTLTRYQVSDPPSSEDTKALSDEFLRETVDLILFAGGDGTARDIFEVVGDRIPILGIPSGVKMRSGVFGLHPSDVAEIIARLVTQSVRSYTSAEILDLGIGSTEYSASEFFGVARTPAAPDLLQRSKTSHSTTSETGLQELAIHYANTLLPGTLYLFGPGGTTQLILRAVVANESLDAAGVHALLDGEVIGHDLSEAQILDLLERYANVSLMVGVIGGQGYLFGRGNQQLSAAVIDRIGWDRITILASSTKLLELMPVVLHVDFTEPLSTPPPSYVKVNTTVTRSVVCRLLHQVASPDK